MVATWLRLCVLAPWLLLFAACPCCASDVLVDAKPTRRQTGRQTPDIDALMCRPMYMLRRVSTAPGLTLASRRASP